MTDIQYSSLWIAATGILVTTAILFLKSGYSPDNKKSAHHAAKQTLVYAYKECAAKKIWKEKPYTFRVPDFSPYSFKPEDRSCAEIISAVSSKPDLHPNYSININSGEKICSHQGKKEQIGGCSSRVNGSWD